MLGAMRAGAAFAVALLCALATGVPADTPVSPAEFREYAEGYTLYFERDGKPAGAETFRPGGEVTWRTPEGVCLEGLWRAYDDELCFYYGINDIVECWQVLRDSQGLKVRHAGGGESDGRGGEENGEAEEDATYRITGRDRRPLMCSGGPALPTRARPGPPVSLPAPRR